MIPIRDTNLQVNGRVRRVINVNSQQSIDTTSKSEGRLELGLVVR